MGRNVPEACCVQKNKHGNTKVPYRYNEDPRLGQWVNNQRTAHKKKAMSIEHASLLNHIGFDWGTISSNWNEMYQRLIAYKNEHNGPNSI